MTEFNSISIDASEFDEGLPKGGRIDFVPMIRPDNKRASFRVDIFPKRPGRLNAYVFSLEVVGDEVVLYGQEGSREEYVVQRFRLRDSGEVEPWTDGYALGIKRGDALFCMNPSGGGSTPDVFIYRGTPEEGSPLCFLPCQEEVDTVLVDSYFFPASKTYTGERSRGKAREVASFVDGEFYARGGWDEVIPALNTTWNPGALGWLIKEGRDVKLMLDYDHAWMRGSQWAQDEPSLCWKGEWMTIEQFKAWLKVAR